MTLGDADLQREVLTLFIAQSTALVAELSLLPADTKAIAHKLKGSARGIGAFAVAGCAERLERAAGNHPAAMTALADLKGAISGTVRAIEDMLRLP
jgi:HPt (histidine-containing phosphotransfer) domain-containing protein